MFDIFSSGSRLSPLNIPDPLLRVELYREIRAAQTDRTKRSSDWGSYVIQPADCLFPELVAYKVYGLDTLKWVVMMAVALDDPRERLQAGQTIWLPKTSWLRERIRSYEARGMRA